MNNKIKSAANRILNSRIFLIIIAIILLAKTIFFYFNTVNVIQEQTVKGIIVFIMALMCFINIIPNRARIIVTLIIDLLISILLFSNNLYYIYSSNFISIEQISNLQYTEEIISTLPKLIKFNQILYFIDFVGMFILFVFKVIKIDKSKKSNLKYKLENTIIFSIGIIVFIMIGIKYIQKGAENSWNKDEQILNATIYGYHISDFINFFNMKNNVKYTNYEEMILEYEKLKSEYAQKYGQVQYNYQNILENKNIIIVQLESVQEFVAHKTINGKEITPNLNKFLNENIEFTNMHMQSYSSTADSEHSTLTSTYPLENGMSYSKYFANTYDNLFNMFSEKKYYTSYMHGNVGTFWNRENVYTRLKIDDINFIDKFEDTSEKISGYLSDELLYKQSVEKMKQYKNPFFTLLVAASSHTAFDLPGIENKKEKVNIELGEYKGTYFGNYLEAVNYADYAFGILVDELKKAGLYDNTAIIVFGDHNGLSMNDNELTKFLSQNNSSLKDIDLTLTYTRVLCGMKIPEVDKHFKIDKVINKLDLKPTIAFLCNMKDEFSLGTNVFGNKDFICLNNERIITQDYYFNRDWYEISTGEKLDLNEISQDIREKLECYYNYMKKELDISFSVNINNLLRR